MSGHIDDLIDYSRLVYDPVRGEYIDPETGEVLIEEAMNIGPEWRAYSQEEYIERARVGPSITNKVHDLGITTFVEGQNKISHLQRRLRRPSDSVSRREVEAKTRLNEIAGKIGLPEIVVEDAGYLIKKLVNVGLIKKRSMDLVIGALIYKICEIRRINIDKEQLSRALGVEFGKIFKTAKKLEWNNVFNELREKMSKNYPIKEWSVCGGHKIDVHLENLDIPKEIKDIAMRILVSSARADSAICSGKNPRGLLGAVIYIASIISGNRIAQQDLANLLGVSEVTIRNRYKNILDKIDIVVEI